MLRCSACILSLCHEAAIAERWEICGVALQIGQERRVGRLVRDLRKGVLLHDAYGKPARDEVFFVGALDVSGDANASGGDMAADRDGGDA